MAFLNGGGPTHGRTACSIQFSPTPRRPRVRQLFPVSSRSESEQVSLLIIINDIRTRSVNGKRVTLWMTGGSPGPRILQEALLGFVLCTAKASTSFRVVPAYGYRSVMVH